jgi:hypothetical protein
VDVDAAGREKGSCPGSIAAQCTSFIVYPFTRIASLVSDIFELDCYLVILCDSSFTTIFKSTSLNGGGRLYRSSATCTLWFLASYLHYLLYLPSTILSFVMGPPRRARSNSSVSNYSQQHRNRHPQSVEPALLESIPPAQSHLGMSPHSRYLSNMKVVRRRDPSIVSIFDQFSHVCVYHHNGDKWEKQGYEGSMFLYERCVLHISYNISRSSSCATHAGTLTRLMVSIF